VLKDVMQAIAVLLMKRLGISINVTAQCAKDGGLMRSVGW